MREAGGRVGRALGRLATLGLLVTACVPGAAGSPAKPERNGEGVKIDVDAVSRATPRRLRRPLEITRISTFEALSFDPARRQSAPLTYRLSKPAWVRIRYIARRDPRLLLRTLVDWSPRQSGGNEEAWDGRDASGYWIDRKICPGRFFIEGESPEHEAHDRDRCGDPELGLESPAPGEKLSGRIPIEVFFSGSKRGYLAEVGGSIRLYVDCQLAAEREIVPGSREPIQMEWNSWEAAGGRHLLTVNLEDGYDHVGTASVEVEIQDP